MSWVETYRFNVSFPYEVHIHGLSDLQIGSESTSLRVIKDRIAEIVADPVDSGVFILGDIPDDDRPTTRIIKQASLADRQEVLYSGARDHMLWIDQAVIPLLLPLQKTKYGIMGILAGHHWMRLSPDLNSVEYICNRLGELSKRRVPYLGVMSSFVDFRFQSKGGANIRSVGFIQHGVGGGQTKGSTLSKLDRTTQGFEADWYMRAHDCQLVATKTDMLYPKMTKEGSAPDILSRTITMLNLGAATQGYQPSKKDPSYIEAEMMRPVTMGWASLKLKIRKAHSYEDKNQSYRIDTKVEF